MKAGNTPAAGTPAPAAAPNAVAIQAAIAALSPQQKAAFEAAATKSGMTLEKYYTLWLQQQRQKQAAAKKPAA